MSQIVDMIPQRKREAVEAIRLAIEQYVENAREIENKRPEGWKGMVKIRSLHFYFKPFQYIPVGINRF